MGDQQQQQQEEGQTQKWEGETRVEVKGYTPAQIWPLVSDFSSLHKWFPHVATCHLLDGAQPPGQPGVIRYCGSTDGAQWAKERLTRIDHVDMSFSYEILDNNAGFKSYVSTVRLEHVEGAGCAIVWSFVADPVEGLTLEGLLGFFDFTAKAMAKRLEEAFSLHEESEETRPDMGRAEAGQVGLDLGRVGSAEVEINIE